MSNIENDESKQYLKSILKQVALFSASYKSKGRNIVEMIANIVTYAKEFNTIIDDKVIKSVQTSNPDQMVFFSEIIEDNTIKRLYNSADQLGVEYSKFKNTYPSVQIDYAIPYAYIDEVVGIFQGIKNGTTMGMKLSAMNNTAEFLKRLAKVAEITAKLIAKAVGMSEEEFNEIMKVTETNVDNKLEELANPMDQSLAWDVPKTNKAKKLNISQQLKENDVDKGKEKESETLNKKDKEVKDKSSKESSKKLKTTLDNNESDKDLTIKIKTNF